MLKSKRFHCLGFLAAPFALLLGVGCAQLPANEPIQIEIADYRAYLADDHPVRQGMRRFAERVETQSAGTLRVSVRNDAVPGAPAAQLERFLKGGDRTPQFMLFAGTGLVPLHPEMGFLDLPFVLRDAQHADAQLSGPFGQALLNRLTGRGIVGLALWENGFRHVTNSTAPLMAIKDLEGLKFRVAPDAVFENTFQAVRAETKQLPFSDLRQALADKSLEAQDNFLSQIWVGRLHEVQPYLSMTHHSYGVLVMAVNETFWKQLSPEQRSLVKKAALDAGMLQRKVAREADVKAREMIKAHGVLINEIPAVEILKWREKTEPLRAKFKESMDPELLGKYQ
jgi:tripartite ATP-independent transporter DctP family solute receptor